MAERAKKWATIGRAVTVIMVCGWLSACAMVPHYERPDLDLPDAKTTADAQKQQQAMVDWWKRFNDPVLDQLIDNALGRNLNIALQASKIREARAQLGLARTKFYPTLSGQAKAGRDKASLLANPQRKGHRYADSYSVAATLGYEINIFSALAGHEAAQAQLLASAYSYDAMRLSVVSDVVANYMSLRAIQRKLRISRATVKTRTQGLELSRKRYKYGAIDQLELLQNEALLSSVKSQLPALEQQESSLESSLAILTGMTPREIMQDAEIKPKPLTNAHLPEKLPKLLPSALINRRPDIRAAEAQLVEANATVSVAKAQYFPTLNLTAMIGTAATSVGDLFTSLAETGSIGAGLTAPILSFGRISSQVDTAKARREQATIQYRLTVRRAFKEVRDALIGVKVTQKRVDASRRQVNAYEKTLKLAKDRYDVGRVGLQNVLDAQRQLYSAQLELSEAIRDRFVATANLFKALGGGWTEDTNSVPKDVDTGLPPVPDSNNNSES